MGTFLCLFLSIGAIGQVQDPTPERCFEALHVCGAYLDGLQGTLPDSNIRQDIWPILGNTGGNSGVCALQNGFNNTIWYSFVACDTTVHLKINYSNCVHPDGIMTETGIQLGMYSKCKLTSSVSCAQNSGTASGVLELKYNKFVPGELVFIVLDGYDASVCDFRIEVVKGVDKSIPTKPDASLLNDGAIVGQNIINCRQKGFAQTYTLTKPECKINYPANCTSTSSFSPNGVDSIKYVWEISPKTGRYFVNDDSIGVQNDIVFTENGVYTISAKPIFHPAYGGICDNGACGNIFSWTVNVKQADTLFSQPLVVCPGAPFDFCGNLITKDTVIFCEGADCDVIAQSFIVKVPIVTNLGTQTICDGGTYSFQGVDYTDNGSFSVEDINNCANTFRFTINKVDINVNISTSGNEINCTTPSINMTGSVTTSWPGVVSYEWRRTGATSVLSTDPNYNTTLEGTYTCNANVVLASGETCTNARTVILTKNVTVPLLSYIVPMYKCRTISDPIPSININSSIALTSSVWKRPNGTIFNGLTIVLDSALVASGQAYTFTGIAANGCKVDTMITVPFDFRKSTIAIDGNMLTCSNPITRLNLTSSLTWDAIKWERDGTFFTCCDNSTTTGDQDKAGVYVARVRALESQCYSSGSKVITEDKLKPTLSVDKEAKWYCNTKDLQIIPTSIANGNGISYQWKGIGIVGDVDKSSVIVSAPGQYIINVFDAKNGCSKSDTTQIVNETNVPTNIQNKIGEISCFGRKDATIEILNVDGGFTPYQYFVNEKKVNPSEIISQLGAGTYTLSVKDKYDCTVSSVLVIDEPKQLTVDVEPQFVVLYDDEVLIDFLSSYNLDELAEIEWLNDVSTILGTDETLLYKAIADDEITLIVKNNNGCEAQARIKIFVNSDVEIFMPNAFSPNGDGKNDRLVVFKNKIPVSNGVIKIYDRFGNLMYDDNIDFNNENAGWDGQLNGKYVENGVYIYILDAIDFKGNAIREKGSVLVAR